MKNILRKIPYIGTKSKPKINITKPENIFTNSKEYWINRYEQGGNSGVGSYDNLADFKSEVINSFVTENNIESVIELGFGDGNQLEYFQIPSYIGFDISETVIEKCKLKFKEDSTKQFLHMNDISNQKADLVMSLDVIYHLIEDDVYHDYMNQLFNLSEKYVIIYSLDSEDSSDYAPHVKPRKFTSWIKNNKQSFNLIEHIPNRYPYDENNPRTTSFADFYLFEK